MISEKRLAMRSIPFLLIGLSIFICYLYFFVGIPEMIAIIQSVNLFFYSLAVVALLLAMVFYSLTWQYFLRPLSVKVPFRKTFLFNWVGIFVDLLIPAESISGDAAKIYLITKDSNENPGNVVASIVSHRILSTTINLISLIIGSLAFLILKYELPSFILNLILLVAIGNAISIGLLFLLCLRKEIAQKIIDSLLNFLKFILRGRLQLTTVRLKVRKALKAFHQAFEVLGRNPKSLVQPVVFSLTSWFFSAFVSFLVFVSLGYPIHFSFVIIVYSISVAIRSIPVGIPGEVGVMEVLMTTLYSLFGVPISISAAATVLIRVLTVWFRLFIGFMAVQWVGVKALTGSSHKGSS
jgi:uncharacterized protein (TIRG00374 family)